MFHLLTPQSVPATRLPEDWKSFRGLNNCLTSGSEQIVRLPRGSRRGIHTIVLPKGTNIFPCSIICLYFGGVNQYLYLNIVDTTILLWCIMNGLGRSRAAYLLCPSRAMRLSGTDKDDIITVIGKIVSAIRYR